MTMTVDDVDINLSGHRLKIKIHELLCQASSTFVSFVLKAPGNVTKTEKRSQLELHLHSLSHSN